MPVNRSTILKSVILIGCLIGLQIWFRWNGNTDRESALATTVLSCIVAALYAVILLMLILVQRWTGQRERAAANTRALLVIICLGAALSFLNGIVVQL